MRGYGGEANVLEWAVRCLIIGANWLKGLNNQSVSDIRDPQSILFIHKDMKERLNQFFYFI